MNDGDFVFFILACGVDDAKYPNPTRCLILTKQRHPNTEKPVCLHLHSL